MAICPNEHFHFLLLALRDQDRQGVMLYLAELLAWLVIPGNPLPKPPISRVSDEGVEAAELLLREAVTRRRASIASFPNFAHDIQRGAGEIERVADALAGVRQLIDLVMLEA